MFKRMTDKLGSHFHGYSKEQYSSSPIQSPISSIPSTAVSSASSLLPQYDHRGSISTERTSLSASDWSKRGDSLDYIEEEKSLNARPRKHKGTYRLEDFIIQRTLGTGSFGRVHLGEMPFIVGKAIAPDQCTSSSE